MPHSQPNASSILHGLSGRWDGEVGCDALSYFTRINGYRQQPRIGAPDPALTPNAGLAAISELCDRLGVIEALDAAVGPIKQRDRGFGAGELLTGIASAQLAGEDFLTGAGPAARRSGRAAAGAGARVVLDDGGGTGPPAYSRAVAGG